ncbi:MAG: hypothetical protein R6V85_04950 [Polyangia bacterium]
MKPRPRKETVTMAIATCLALLVGCGDLCEDCECECDTDDPGGGDGVNGLPFVPSNLEGLDLEGLDGDLVFDGTTCDTGMLNFELGEAGCTSDDSSWEYFELEQSDGSLIGVFAARNIRVEQTIDLRAHGSLPIALVATGEVTIAGVLDGGPNLLTDGMSGGFDSPDVTDSSHEGNGPGGGEAGAEDHGGGGGSYCGAGGQGGNGEDSGAVYGHAELVPLIGGSSGGNIFSGAGGGALQIVAGEKIRITASGAITVPGGGGQWGGGGSGGAVLLEAPSVIVDGTVAANGGGGSGGGSGDGESGLIGDQPASGAYDPDSPHNAGGNGGAGDDPDGEDGLCDDPPCYIPGSGGGGAGRIRINAEQDGAEISGILSPSPETDCTTIGVID